MPTTVNNNFYKDIAKTLAAKYPNRLHKYFHHQNYTPIDSPFSAVTPRSTDMFGPRLLTILIISKHYEYPQVLLDYQRDIIKQVYPIHGKFKVLVWVDLTLANLSADGGDEQFKLDMLADIDKIEAFCNELKDYGFKYMGEFNSQPSESVFIEHIDAFYKE